MSGEKETPQVNGEDNGFRDIWEQIKATAQKLEDSVKDAATKTLEKFKKTMEAVTWLKHVVVVCGKELIIEIKDRIIKIIAGGQVAISDESNAAEFYFDGEYVMLVFKDAELAVDNGLKETWSKVKEAFRRFGDKVKSKSEQIWKKIGPAAEKALHKYKDIIIGALEKDGKVIINEGRKIVITVINDVVKVIIDGIDAVSGEKEEPKNEIAENGFFDGIWDTVYDNVISKLGEVVGKATIDTITKHKEAFMKALKHLGSVIVEGGHKLEVKIVKDVRETIIEIFKDGEKIGEVPVEGENELVENGIAKELWDKVYDNIISKLGQVVGKATIDTITKHKEAFIKALVKLKLVILEGGHKLSVKIMKDIKETVIEIFVDGKKAGEVTDPTQYALENTIFQNVWDKIRAAVHQLGDEVVEVVEAHKPQIIKALKDLKKVVVKGAKTVIIEVRDAVIKVISEGQSATSDGSSFQSVEKVYAVVEADNIFGVVE